MSESDGVPRSPRQPVPAIAPEADFVGESDRKWVARASIRPRCKKTDLIATNLQLHLVITQFIPAGPDALTSLTAALAVHQMAKPAEPAAIEADAPAAPLPASISGKDKATLGPKS